MLTPEVPRGLEIRLFGPLSVLVNGQPAAPPRTRKGFWLLALLVLRHGRAVERSWLAGTLWPDSPESQALYNLRRSISDLRNVLGPAAACLVSPTPRTLSLDIAPDAVDVLQFAVAVGREDTASLDTAIALSLGPLLEGCTEAWVLPEREAREQQLLTALEKRATLALENNEMGRAESLARRAIAADLGRETAWRLLLTALARSGNYAALAATYRDLRLRLRREYNQWPDPQTAALFETLRAEAQPSPDASRPQSGGFRPSVPETLAYPRTALIGREEQITEVTDALRSSRLLTLTGAGGIGKTRLALATAAAACAAFPDGVWFVDLAATTDPGLVPSQAAQTVNVREAAGNSFADALCRVLRSGQFLLILDNCEHLRDACAELCETLLEGTEGLRILATSRMPLGVADERTWRVPSLPVPASSVSEPLETATLQTYAAVRLFVERAEPHRPDFRLTPDNAAAVVEICRGLDGIPLAIELAAARTRHLDVKDIVRRLDNVLLLLTGGSRTVLSRQQTLRASIDWSWSLLAEREQTLLARLSVFAGGFTLEAVEAVCREVPPAAPAGTLQRTTSVWERMRDDEGILDLLGRLIDNSLVLYPADSAGRYRLPEPVRQYAAQRRAGAEDEADLRERHAAYYLSLAEAARPHFEGGPTMTAWLDLFAQEHDNLRRALEWYEQAADVASAARGLRLGGVLQAFWLTRGYHTEGRRRLTALLTATAALPPDEARALVLNGVGQIAAYQGDRDAALALHEQAMNIYRNADDRRGMAETYNYMGELARQREQYALAEDCFQKALAVLPAGEPSNLTAQTRFNLGTVYYRTERCEEAARVLAQSLREFDRHDNRQQRVLPLLVLAHVARITGRDAEAAAWTKATLEGCRESSDVHTTVFGLELAAMIACQQGAAGQAARLLGTASALRERLGARPTRAQQVELDTLVSSLQVAMDAETFAGLLAEGRTLSLAQALTLAVSASTEGTHA